MGDLKMKLTEYEGKGLNKHQLEEVSLGFENGLSSEQVAVYAKAEFNRYQMCQIRTGFQNGLSREQVDVFAVPIYTEAQMCELRVASELGMSSEEISELAHPEHTWQEMWRKRVEMRKNANERASLSDVIKSAESRKVVSEAPEHYKQEDFQL